LGAWIGYQRGAAAIEVIARSRLADVAMVLKRVTVVMLGGLCAVLVHSGDLTSAWGLVAGILTVSIVYVGVFLLRKGVPTAVVLCALIVGVAVVDKMVM